MDIVDNAGALTWFSCRTTTFPVVITVFPLLLLASVPLSSRVRAVKVLAAKPKPRPKKEDKKEDKKSDSSKGKKGEAKQEAKEESDSSKVRFVGA